MKSILICVLVLIIYSCSEEKNSKETDLAKPYFEESMSFSRLKAEETNINFKNTIVDSDSFNLFTYEYIYNGGGVAVGDVNNDGLTDIYFSGNQVEDKLYLNKGNFKFEDITSTAIGELANTGWHTGVTMVDINEDGWIDIYVSRSGAPSDINLLGNLLFINNQDNTFTEKSSDYGVDVKRMTTQSTFFDFDNDGDLDLYVMNHPIQKPNQRKKSVGEINDLLKVGSPDSDMLLENRSGQFYDISLKAGISNHSYGLGLAVADINNDGYEDIYISNDYMAPDYLYINNGDGSFTDQAISQLRHISNFSMGNDISDFNNDGFPDIFSVDMASEDHIRSKKNMSGMSTQKFWDVVNVGFHHQYMFNALQLNNGNGTFSDIAQSAGISKTDWSWAPLFVDLDNDGLKDLFISNGYRRDSRDNDYMAKTQNPEAKQKPYLEKLELMPATKIQNYIFKNDGDYHFDKKMNDWKTNFSVNTNGAAFADLDNDGDLDFVLNNIDETSMILRNNLNTKNNYLRIDLKGKNKSLPIGSKVKVKTENGMQYQELQITRGYQSSVEPTLHFGLGKAETIIEVLITWPDGKTERLLDVKPNQTLEVVYNENVSDASPSINAKPVYFEDITTKMQTILHKEIKVNDFEKEVLLPHKMSQLGPFLSSGDVNQDGLDDFYLSGSRNFAGQLYVQQSNGKFKLKNGPWQKQSALEEMESVFFDIDLDGDLDLYVVSGSNEFDIKSDRLFDQLYINDGKGNFKNESKDRLPEMITSGQSIAIADIDNDGDEDLFLGGRQTPGFYPFAPRSYLLLNDNGYLKDITGNSKDILGPGLITSSIFDDFDGDGDQDLICVGEWMPISFFENKNMVFENVTATKGTAQDVGWWYSITKGDFNGDGKNDYVVGNVGENNKFHPSKQYPLELYCSDFDNSGSYDIVLAKYQNNVCYPVRGKECTTEQMPFISKKFPSYSDFAEADINKLYGKDKLDNALHFSASNFSSSILLSSGSTYKVKRLPSTAQFSPLNSFQLTDINGDSHLDIIGVGNNFGIEVETVRYDAGTGIVLLGDGTGNFSQLRSNESGWFTNTDDKDLIYIKIGGKDCYLIASNSNKIRWIELKKNIGK